MAEDKQDRLNKLIELRNSGVLTEAEFQIARTRVLAARGRAEGGAQPDEPSFLGSWWPALAGVGILVLLIAAIVIYGRMQAEEDTVDLNITIANEMAANVLDVGPSGAEVCASDTAYARIRDLIFERAQQQYGGAPGPLDSLRRAVGVRMQYPLVREIRQDIGRTDCTGHLVLDLPPSVHAAFDGLPALESDIQYSVQPAADGSTTAVEIAGADQVIQQLAVAASLVGGPGKAPAADPAQPPQIFNPSFACRGSLSNVERMICQDEQLSQLDRALAERYLSLRRALSGPDWALVSDSQREFLRDRARCPDVACLHDAYIDQVRYLDRIAADLG